MTSVLFLLVIAMWVAIVIPTFLTRHDRRELERSFQKPLTEQLEQRWKMMQRPAPSARERAFRRRRRVMMTLLTSLVATLTLGLTHTISLLWILPPLLLFAAFIAAASRAVKKQQIRPQQLRTTTNPRDAVSTSTTAATRTTATSQAGSLNTWRPHTTPLPTYMTANQAVSSPLGYSSTRPWTSAEMLDQAAALREQRTARFQEAQARLEEARARALERARIASNSAMRANREYQDPRAVNE